MAVPSIGIGISAYGHPAFLDRIYSIISGISAVQRIYILDGPFHFTEKIYSNCGYYTSEADSTIYKQFNDRPKIAYKYSLFLDEREKRIQLYEWIKEDIVVLLDLDEVPIDICQADFLSFWHSQYSVASADFVNIVSQTRQAGGRSKKYIVFKRHEVSAVEHLNYTWLVGVKQDPPNRDLMSKVSMFRVLHFFLARPAESLRQKILFYHSLWYSENTDNNISLPTTVESLAEQSSLDKTCEAGLILDSLISMNPDYLGVPIQHGKLQEVDDELSHEVDASLCNIPFKLFEQSKVLLPTHLNQKTYLKIPLSQYKIVSSDKFIEVIIETNSANKLRFELCYPSDKCRVSTSLMAKRLFLEPSQNLFTWKITIPLFGFITENLDLCLISVESSEEVLDHRKNSYIFAKSASLRRDSLKVCGFGNCQIESILHCIKSSPILSTYLNVVQLQGRLVHMMTDSEMEENILTLRNSDIILVQPIRDGYRSLSYVNTSFVLTQVSEQQPHIVMFPSLFYTAQNPFTQTISIKGNHLAMPSPLQDLYMVYLALTMGKVKGKSKYLRSIDDPSFITSDSINLFHHCNMKSLSDREEHAIKEYGKSINAFVKYSTLIEKHVRKSVIHYSDAHPTEVMIREISKDILAECGFADQQAIQHSLLNYSFEEKGMFPIYKSVASLIEPTEDKLLNACYIHNHEFSRGDFVDRYFDVLVSNYADLQESFIQDYCSKFIVTNHKTGTMFMLAVFDDLVGSIKEDEKLMLHKEMVKNSGRVPNNLNLQNLKFGFIPHCQHFTELKRLYKHLRYRCLHVIRDPVDIILSGVRYHLITDEGWCHKKVFVKSNSSPVGYELLSGYSADHPDATHSYQHALQSLGEDERILFEIYFHSRTHGTINSINAVLNEHLSDPNIMIQSLETLNQSVDKISKFLALNSIQSKILKERCSSLAFLGKHVTSSANNVPSESLRSFVASQLVRYVNPQLLLDLYADGTDAVTCNEAH